MRLEEYRERLERFQEEVGLEHFLYFSGQKEHYELARIYGDYSDLFSRDSIDELKRLYRETPEHLESRRKSIKKLIAFAVQNHLELGVKELTESIAERESRAHLSWDGREISFFESSVALANEPQAARRRELHRLRSRIVAETNELRLERLERLRDACRTLGYASYYQLHREILDIDYQALARKLSEFLERTESLYTGALEPALKRELGLGLQEAHRADVGYFTRLPRYDRFFPADDLVPCYRATLERLGIDFCAQKNIKLDTERRPRKHPRAFCVAIKVPHDVRLVIMPQGGQEDYQAFFHEGGHAQHFAWTSASLAVEDKFCGDRAVSETYAFLFNYLLADREWLSEMLRFSGALEEFVKLQLLFRLHILRRYSAKLLYEIELHSDGSEAEHRYAQLLSEATKFSYDGVDYLRDLDDGFYSADYLRAWIFEAQLEDYLKRRYGSRWYRSKKAGDFLKEVWETGERYSADELAAQIGLGALETSALMEGLAQIA